MADESSVRYEMRGPCRLDHPRCARDAQRAVRSDDRGARRRHLRARDGRSGRARRRPDGRGAGVLRRRRSEGRRCRRGAGSGATESVRRDPPPDVGRPEAGDRRRSTDMPSAAASGWWRPRTSPSPPTRPTFSFSEVRIGVIPAMISVVVLPEAGRPADHAPLPDRPSLRRPRGARLRPAPSRRAGRRARRRRSRRRSTPSRRAVRRPSREAKRLVRTVSRLPMDEAFAWTRGQDRRAVRVARGRRRAWRPSRRSGSRRGCPVGRPAVDPPTATGVGRRPMTDVLRIANCSGFYGDRLSAAREMVEGGPIDVLTGDYLAELTLMILLKDRLKDRDARLRAHLPPPARGGRGALQGARHQDRGERRRAQPRRLRRGGARPLRRSSACAPSSRTSRATISCRSSTTLQARGRAASRTSTRACRSRALRRAGADRQRLPRRLGHRRGARARRRPRDLPARHRRGAHARAGGVEVRVEARRLGPARGGRRRRPHHRVRRAVHRRQLRLLPRGAATSSIPGFPIAEMHADGSFVVTKHPGTGGLVSRRHGDGAAALRDRRRRAIRTPTSPRASTPSALRRRGPTACACHGIRASRRRRPPRSASTTSAATRTA